MTAIVIVSHSLRLAQGIEELALQMSGGKVPLAVAAGIDDPQNPIGTDAIAILSAIESVWSPAGVLVFMDMGSALLSTEMALELLSEEQRAAVHLMSAPVVEGVLSAIVCAAAELPISAIIAEAASALDAKRQHLHPNEAAATDITPEPGQSIAEQAHTLRWTVRNFHGIHARPAAKIVATAARCDAEITVINGDKRASARSLNGLAMLGIRCGDEILFQISGHDASQAIQLITSLAQSHFGESHALEPVANEPQPVQRITAEGAVSGLPVNEGIAIGCVKWFSCELPEFPLRTPASPAEEMAKIDSAIGAVLHALEQKALGPEGEIFAAHQAMLDDPEIRLQVLQELGKGDQAETAWMNVMQEVASRYRHASSPYFREREADVHDLARQVLLALCGVSEGTFATHEPCILLADDLLPSQVANLDKRHILGICLRNGGATSHSAILARAMGIPAVVKAAIASTQIPDGAEVILDGGKGQLWFDPDDATRLSLIQRHDEWRQSKASALASAAQPAITRHGQRINVLANIGGPEDVDAALAQGAEGVGLFRTEFLFHDAAELPGEDEQFRVYCDIARAFGDKPVTIRTLDIGGDKPLAALPQAKEDNPFLGLRGIRLCLASPQIFIPQLRALLRAGALHPNLQIMLPMISTQDEVAAVQALTQQQAQLLNIPQERLPALGIMIEVPAAVMIADALAQQVDFFSIGTNDLTQYIMAADRGNSAVAELVDYRNEAVVSAIARVCEAGRTYGIPVSMCGEMAGDVTQTALLLRLGIDKLSASAARLPALKATIREL
ncbi:phosphoenolpyruvate--protein phosphotransferase [[Enterobacter] lignolyticus]|uniref:Phosphoenolpyruvate-protein phosphotransferase n=1 Tax=Enterobacter lignolyticus (strain SCF1) TaxID=701347 RepID=E3G884_ENTLS|nr:phosphoenolpyruvate--protein phosphotransferase [[Enterobacter] lignolyticus]ADO49752.1 phosphoenolpyruvate-protein phosphotransferase [[Enterobacter] lignolyticus SCF1]